MESTNEVLDVISLAREELIRVKENPEDYKIIQVKNLIIKGKTFAGPQFWQVTFKLKSLIPKDNLGIIGAGGEIFVEVDMNSRNAKITGYGE